MTFTITKGMAGKRVETLGKYSAKDVEDNEIDKMFADFYAWKKQVSESKKYRVSSYDRQLFNDKEHKIVIDFGDYSHFGLIKARKKEWEVLENHMCKPVDLEV